MPFASLSRDIQKNSIQLSFVDTFKIEYGNSLILPPTGRPKIFHYT